MIVLKISKPADFILPEEREDYDMKIRKIIALWMALAALLGLCACGAPAPSVGGSADSGAASVQEPSGGEAEPEEPGLEEPEEPSEPVKEQEAFEEIVLVEDENCIVKITGIEENGIWGYTWKVYLENRTAGNNLMFSLENCSVNGVMCEPFWAASVAAGMKANEEISWSSSTLEENGIQQVTAVEGSLRIYDNDDWVTEFYHDSFAVYPLGQEAAQTVERAGQESDVVLVDTEEFTVLATGFYMDDIWGYTMDLHIENRSERNIMVGIEACAVNGFMCDPFWAASVAAGKQSNEAVSWFSDDFEANGITEVESISMTIRISDSDSFGELYSESVVIDL